MKGVFKIIGYASIVIVLAIVSILLYQTFGISDETDWENLDETELKQKESTTNAVNNSSIFDDAPQDSIKKNIDSAFH